MGGCYHGHSDSLLVAAGSGVAETATASSAGVPDCLVKLTVVKMMAAQGAVFFEIQSLQKFHSTTVKGCRLSIDFIEIAVAEKIFYQNNHGFFGVAVLAFIGVD